MAIDDVDSGRKDGITGDERRELVELRRRTWVLEMENEISSARAPTSRENVLPLCSSCRQIARCDVVGSGSPA
ncbi:MAG: hypothetical protein ABJA87_03715 [bacterium]